MTKWTDRFLIRKRRVKSAYGRPTGFRPYFWLALALGLALATPVSARPLRVVALGDSLTAGYSLPADAAFPAQLQRALRSKGFDVEIANAGVSGDTSSGALERLDWALGEGADGVLVEIGANDMLRGTDPALTRKNIEAILARLQQRKIPALLTGMRAAPNLGPEYAQEFDRIYPDLAKKYDTAFYPFFLDGVAGHPERQLPDGMHPNREGVAIVVAGILPEVAAWLERIQKN
jgi:acyl-CoA thioesterase-1